MSETTKLKDISAGKDNLKVYGRLIRLWDARYANTNTLISIDGLLLDDDGTLAQISIPRNLEKEFRSSLSEDNVYMFSGVTAIHQNSKPYTYDVQSYILQFTSTTKIHRLQSRGADIPHIAFHLCSFDGIQQKSGKSKPLLDLIGIISDVGPYDFAGPRSQKKNRKIQIRNLEYICIPTYIDSLYNNMLISVKSPEFRLPVTIKDASSTMDCIAFYNVAEELVGCSAIEASQNMQIESDNQPPVLKEAIGKKRLFNIGMSTAGSSKNPIKYILKRSFTIDNQETNDLEGINTEATPSQIKQKEDGVATPPSTQDIQASSAEHSSSKTKESLNVTQVAPIIPQAPSTETIQSSLQDRNSQTKRRLDFNQEAPVDPEGKQQKTI